jgi:hypothetical protein
MTVRRWSVRSRRTWNVDDCGNRALAGLRPEVPSAFWCDVPVTAADANELTVLVDQLRRDRRRDPYTGRDAYSRAAQEVADHCARLVAAGEAALVVEVLRKAVDRMTTALMSMDSSSGLLGNDLAHLMEVYAGPAGPRHPHPPDWPRGW